MRSRIRSGDELFGTSDATSYAPVVNMTGWLLLCSSAAISAAISGRALSEPEVTQQRGWWATIVVLAAAFLWGIRIDTVPLTGQMVLTLYLDWVFDVLLGVGTGMFVAMLSSKLFGGLPAKN